MVSLSNRGAGPFDRLRASGRTLGDACQGFGEDGLVRFTQRNQWLLGFDHRGERLKAPDVGAQHLDDERLTVDERLKVRVRGHGYHAAV